MKKIKPRLMSGFQEYLPQEQLIFNAKREIIKSCFEKFGYYPIETPTLELSEILLSKEGGETEKEVYRFSKGKNDITLPYDLTVPLARYVTQHWGDLSFPFRRYQIQKVWRAERAQQGRYREFYQCDVDIIGTTNLAADAEVIAIMYKALKNINVPNFKFRINNRKIYSGFLQELKCDNLGTEILRTIDKIHKIGEVGITNILEQLDLNSSQVETLVDFAKIHDTPDKILFYLRKKNYNATFRQGVNELNQVYEFLNNLDVSSDFILFDLSITRGLDYYTGTVCETTVDNNPELGSICSGGRYDNLTTYFSDNILPGVGMSIGLSRLFNKFKDFWQNGASNKNPSQVLFISQKNEYISKSLKIATKLRELGLCVEVAFTNRSIAKQMQYANKAGFPFVIIIGENEYNGDFITVKNMSTGNQKEVMIEEVKKFAELYIL